MLRTNLVSSWHVTDCGLAVGDDSLTKPVPFFL